MCGTNIPSAYFVWELRVDKMVDDIYIFSHIRINVKSYPTTRCINVIIYRQTRLKDIVEVVEMRGFLGINETMTMQAIANVPTFVGILKLVLNVIISN